MLTVQKKIFSLAGMSPKSSNMTAKSGINTAYTSKVYHFLVVGADALTMSEITVDGVSVEKVGGCAREFLVVDGFLCSRSDSTKTFVHTRDVNEMSAMYCASGASNSEFSESIKKSLPLCGNTVYGYKAPHKTGAGIGVLKILKATYDAPSVFFYVVGLTHPFFGRWCIIQRLCQSMVAQAGASSEAPVSFRAGYRTTETPEATSQKREQLETERQRREQERLKRAEKDEQQRRDTFSRQFDDMRRKAVNGKSDYLVAKGVGDFTFPVLPDGSLLLALVDKSGAVTAAQTITSHGEKRLLTGSAKRGAYHAINAPETTQSILIAEGLATALSAHLIRPEALTVAAIDAGNLLYVAQVLRDKYPSAQIIIAADNDHSEGRQNTGRIAAEKAALSVSGWVALPPTDHKADWNDYHQKHGIKCATEAFNKSMYQPQGNGVKQEPQTIEGSDFKVMDTDPLKPRIESREDGIYWVSPRADSQSGEIINNESWLCSPLSVIGTGRDDKDQYLILRWLSFGSETPTTAAIPLADIGEREGWRTLKAGGVNVTTKSSLRAILADWLQRSGSRELWRVAHATGWQCGAYIMPDGEIIGTPENPVLFSGRSSAAAGYTVSGSAKSWRDNVARLAFGNYSMMTGIGAALAAPLIGLVGADGFGIHFYEQSSAGKTTTANVASSLYGNPDLLRLTWYGTALGLANEAAAHNDGLMPLDEVGQGADPVSVSQSAYALFTVSVENMTKAQ